MLYFREGYSLLLHGVGSKRSLINDFHTEIIADHPTLIVNGFFPSLTLKDVSEIQISIINLMNIYKSYVLNVIF